MIERSEELESLWANLSLMEEELTEVVVAKDWLDEVKKVRENCLVGHLVLNKRVNLEAMKKSWEWFGRSQRGCQSKKWEKGYLSFSLLIKWRRKK